jgi:hypothetical protein
MQMLCGLSACANPERINLVRDILKESESANQQDEVLELDMAKFEQAAYWKKIKLLGQIVSDSDLAKLQKVDVPTLEEEIITVAAFWSRNEAEIRQVMDYYTSKVPNGPRAMIEPRLRIEDTEIRDREMWEGILIAPQQMIGKTFRGTIRLNKCAEALAAIGSRRSLPVLKFARERLIVGEARRGRWQGATKSELVRFAANARLCWIMPIAKIGQGSPEGLDALLEALRLCEKEHPEILSLKGLGIDLHPDQKGVADTITEVVFLQKDNEGRWLWKDSIDRLQKADRTAAEREVIRIAKANFAKAK